MVEGNFENSIGGLVGKKIGFYLNDNQFIQGVLLNVKRDHLIVKVDQSVIYFALNQIHACSKNAKDFRVSTQVVPYLNRNNLTDVLDDLKYKWVTINCMTNKTFAGLLSRIYEDHIILLNNTEQLFVQKSYISDIYKGVYESIEHHQENDVTEDVTEDTDQSLSSKEESNQLPEPELVPLLEHESVPSPEPAPVLPSAPESVLSPVSDTIPTFESALHTEYEPILPSEPESILLSMTKPVQSYEPESVQLSGNQNIHAQEEKIIREQKSKNKMTPQEYFDFIKKRHNNDETDDKNSEMNNTQIHAETKSTQDTYVTSLNTEKFQYDNESNDSIVDYLNPLPIKRNRKNRNRKFKLTKSNAFQKKIADATFSLKNKKLLKTEQSSFDKGYEVYYYNTDPNNHHTEPLFCNSLCIPKHKSHKEVSLDADSNILTNYPEYNQSPSDSYPINQISPREEKITLEKQYYALMKYAEKMYLQLKNDRLK
ncbi:hypothetical protein [Rummeliibacillus pycnus]|uniref:hypothetical protein n=1 Tax=Rummeliibacillus pycnus TaxID=101070 RepID=UPI0037C84458